MKKVDIRNLSAKDKKKIHSWIRVLIQIGFFLFLPSAFTAAFAGVKYIFTQIGAGAKIEITSFVSVLITLCVYTMVFGRFFCGFACAFGSLGDALHALYLKVLKKIGKKPTKIDEGISSKMIFVKYGVLFIIVLLCFAGVYSRLQGSSPWDVFSMLHAGNFKLGNYIPGLVFLFIIMAEMCIEERFFCRFLCPMGGVFSMLPVLPLFSLQRNRDNCVKGCSACTKKCPAVVSLPEEGSLEVKGECLQCQKCIDICPKKNIGCAAPKVRGNEVWFTLVRALALLGLLLWMGI